MTAKKKVVKKAAPKKKAVKKKVAKKAAPQKKAVKKKAVKTVGAKLKNGMPSYETLLKHAKAALPRISSGAVSINDERVRLGLNKTGRWRKAIKEVCGGDAGYQKMLAGRPRASRGVGRKFKKGEAPPPKVKISDAAVPVVTSTKFADGWNSEALQVHNHTVDLIIDPEGTKYIGAAANEKADLIVDHSKSRMPALGKIRYRLYETSGTARKVRRQAKLAAKGEKARAVKKAAKKAAKKGDVATGKMTRRRKTAKKSTVAQQIDASLAKVRKK
jgi:hypothetical protein